MEKKPIVPVSEEARQRLLNLQGYVILGRPKGGNSYQGYVENSWTMDWRGDYAVFFWSGEAVSNFGTKHNLNAYKDAKYHFDRLIQDRPDWDIQMFDVRDENIPVVLDWEGWIEAQAYNPNTLSGVTDKFKARNFKFTMKE
jgi:hypothetical protein